MSSERFVDGLVERAAKALPEEVYRYVRQGSRGSVSASEAVAAWDQYRFLPSVMREVTSIHTGTSMLGTPTALPMAVAPTTMQRAAHPDGEVAMARAVAAADSVLVVSSNAGSTFADIAGTGVAWWLQMYLTSEREACLPLLQAAVANGARAVVLTVDTPVVATKYDGPGRTVWDVIRPGWLRVNFPSEHGSTAGAEKAADLGPQDIEWLRQVTGLPVVVKGVLRPQDARRCVEAGAAAVWVSNHGGRQLDYAAATADCLPGVVAEVGSAAEVYVDGGVRSARHTLVALALGARGVFLGRLPLYALAVDGSAGVERMFDELRVELVEALTLAGCNSVSSLPRDLLVGPTRR